MADTLPRSVLLERAAGNARVRRYRLRKAGLLPAIPRCPACGGRVLVGGPLCARCWRGTDEGRRWNRERMRKRRAPS